MGFSLEITIPNKNAPVILIDGLYNELELTEMSLEINALYDVAVLPRDTGGATYDDVLLKNTKGLFLDAHYEIDRSLSKCLTFNRRVFNQDTMLALEKTMPCFSLLTTSNKDNTLVTWYDDKTFYKTHRDGSTLTFLTYFIADSHRFSGGILVFDDFDLEIKPEHGLTVLMLGSLRHSVTTVNSLTQDKQTPRIVMSQFVCHETRAPFN